MTEFQSILRPTTPSATFLGQLEDVMSQAEALDPTFVRFFIGSPETYESELRTALNGRLKGSSVSVIGQTPLDGAAVEAYACSLPGAELLRFDCGLTAEGEDSEAQMARIFHNLEETLASEGMSIADNCIRTWIYVRDIDRNYAGVVKARREYFSGIGLTPQTHYIASTGIAGACGDPRKLVVMDALCVKEPPQVRYLQALSHLNPTYEYGVTFERGASVSLGGHDLILISGTASIDNKGQILHPGDPAMQAERMLENVDALLQEGKSSIAEVRSALVYLRNPSDLDAVRGVISERQPQINAVYLDAPVCRPGWLVEMECMV